MPGLDADDRTPALNPVYLGSLRSYVKNDLFSMDSYSPSRGTEGLHSPDPIARGAEMERRLTGFLFQNTAATSGYSHSGLLNVMNGERIRGYLM
jgi:hypothetical protein